MNVRSITAEHFMAFREPVTLPLDAQGLVLVRGDNRVSAAANDNGAGKSSLAVHVPSVAWFGKTLIGPDAVKGQDLACRFTKDPCVLTTAFDGGAFVRRFRPYAVELRRDGREPVYGDEAEAAFLDALGYGFRTFHYAQVFSGGSLSKFARADQPEQMRMIDEIQGLDFRGALDAAKRWRDEWRAKAAEAQAEIDGAARELSQAQAALAGHAESRRAFEATKRERVATAERMAVGASQRAAGLRRELAALRLLADRLPALRAAEDAAITAMDTYREAKQKLSVEEAKLPAEERALGLRQAALDRAEQAVADLLHAKVCPTCRGKIIGARAKEVEAAFRPDVKEARSAVDAQAKKTEAQRNAVRKARAAYERAEAEWKDAAGRADSAALNAAASASARLPVVEREIETAEAQAAANRDAVEAEQLAVWDGEAAMARAADEVRRLDVVGKAKAGLVRKAELTVSAAEYWVEAFGDRGIRSLMFESVAPFLNERLAQHLAVLASGEASVSVSALRELKSGKRKEALTVEAAWAWGGGQYAVGSGGQGGRVDLALFAALQDLGESRSARPFAFKVWDEPGDALDARGKEIFCRWVETEARRRGTGFLVTHQEDIAQGVTADQTWTVVLEPDGARLEVER